jgi:hypothetical protein
MPAIPALRRLRQEDHESRLKKNEMNDIMSELIWEGQGRTRQDERGRRRWRRSLQ